MAKATPAYLMSLTAFFFPTVTTQIANVLCKRSWKTSLILCGSALTTMQGLLAASAPLPDRMTTAAGVAEVLSRTLAEIDALGRAGHGDEMERLCRRLLDEYPHCADAWNRLAIHVAGRSLISSFVIASKFLIAFRVPREFRGSHHSGPDCPTGRRASCLNCRIRSS